MKRSISEVSQDAQDLQIQLLTPKGKTPTRSTSEVAGYDLYSSEDIKVPPRTRILVSTDIAIQVPPGTYGRIAPRSSISVKNCINIGARVIDKDYRGQIKILLINHSDTEFLVQQGDRIAQLILEHIKTPDTKTVQSLQATERGSKGFGSTATSSKPVYGERLFFKAKLKIVGHYIQARLLLDCGATSPILHEEYTKDNQILTKQRKKPIRIWNASQQPIAGAGRFYPQPLGLVIGNHSEVLVWEVGVIEDSIDGYLPVAWLQKHNPDVNWKTGQVKWRSPYCVKNCLPKQVNALLVNEA